MAWTTEVCGLAALTVLSLAGCDREPDVVARAPIVRADGGGMDAGSADAGQGDAGADDGGSDRCVRVEQPVVRETRAAADVLIGVDGSSDMGDLLPGVQQALSDFAFRVLASDVDLRLVLVARGPDETRGLCIPAPLGSGDCSEDDSNPPRYLHVAEQVINLVLGDILEDDVYQVYAPLLRDNAEVHLVVISNDSGGIVRPETWDERIRERDPRYADYTLHAVVPTQPEQCGEVGELYPELVAQSGGVLSDLCAGAFDPVFQAIGEGVVDGAAACEWAIPAPPTGVQFDPERVNVLLETAQGPLRTVGHVPSRADCARAREGQGWYFESAQPPRRMLGCPATCERIRAEGGGRVHIGFDCVTLPADFIQ